MAIATITEAALYRLLSWLSPAYPVGGYSYSHGIEYAVEAKHIRDRVSLETYVAATLEDGGGRVDAALLVAAWRATRQSNGAGLGEIADLAAAWRGTAELALEGEAQGRAFLATTRAAWPHSGLDALFAGREGVLMLPVVVGAAAALHGVPLAATVAAYLHAFAANLVSAGVRLVPLGQTDGQRAIAALEPVVARAAANAMATPLDEITTAAPMIDWCSMQHETQYTRLFRS